MAVIYRGLIGRSASNAAGIRSYTRKYKLQTTDRSDDEYIVGSNVNLPQIGSTHPSDSGAWCTALEVDNHEPWSGWMVTAQWDSTFELNINPIFDPAEISWDFEQFEKVAIIDNAGNAITNSAGDIFTDPPPMMDDSRPVVSISKNVAAVPAYVLTYQDAVNSSAFTVDGITVATGQAKCNRISISPRQERNGFQFRTVNIEIHLRREGWLLEPLDVGWRSKSGADRFGVFSTDGTAPKTQVLLNGSGAVIANPSSSDGVYLSYAVYNTADFNALPLS